MLPLLLRAVHLLKPACRSERSPGPAAVSAGSRNSAAAALAVVLVAFAPAERAWSQAAPSVYIDDLTWTELRDAIKAGKTTVIVPIGGTEQSGPHMALGKHNVRAKFLSGRIAAALGNALVAPVVDYVPEGSIDPPTQHMKFPGTITIPDDVFDKLLESAARSFRLHGFRDIVFLGDHGGYQQDEVHVAKALDKEWAGSSARVHAVEAYYRAAASGFSQILKGRGYSESEIGTHAGLNDTSLMLAVDPSLVRVERLSSGSKAGVAEGVHGDPTRSSAELGKLGVDLIVGNTVDAIKAAVAAH